MPSFGAGRKRKIQCELLRLLRMLRCTLMCRRWQCIPQRSSCETAHFEPLAALTDDVMTAQTHVDRGKRTMQLSVHRQIRCRDFGRALGIPACD